MEKIIKKYRIIFLFIAGVFAFQFSMAQINVDVVNAVCNGANGTITVTGTEVGFTEPYQFSFNGGAPGASNVYSGPAAPSINVTVIDALLAEVHNQDYPITQPDSVSYTLSGQDWSCPNPGCNGEITVSPTGGTGSYTVEINSISGTTLSGLCGGIYPISVVDDGGCALEFGLPTTVTITEDNLPPVCTPPVSYHTDYATFGVPTTIDTFQTETYTPGDGVGFTSGFITIFAENYTGVEMEITVSQSTTSVWDDSDSMKISLSYDGGINYNIFMFDSCRWGDGTAGSPPCTGDPLYKTSWVALPSGDQSSFRVQVQATSAAGNTYNVTGRFRGGLISSGESGSGPTDCTDLGGVDEITYTDGSVSYFNGCLDEFEFVRTWKVTDVCGQFVEYPQTITVGTIPALVMGLNGPLSFDFCHNVQTIPTPSATDNCYTDAGDFTYNWIITDEDLNETSGSGEITSFPFVVGQTSTIEWEVVDGAGFTSVTANQQVTISPEITATVAAAPAFGSNNCDGTEVVFTVSNVLGGSSSYITYDWTPFGGTWSNPTYTISSLPVGTNDIFVEITDSDNCSSTLNPGIIYIYQNIVTNQVRP